MQVQNNYNFHNQTNNQSHIGTKSSASSYQKGDAAKTAVEYVASFSVQERSETKKKSGIEAMKGYWNSLGEEKGRENTFDLKKSVSDGIYGAVMSMQTFFADKVVKLFVSVKDRLKTIPTSLIKRFGKGKEAFNALTGGSTTFGQKNPNAKDKEKNKPINTLKATNEHLTDSYNKTGLYCQLQDNLTYQKPKGTHTIEKSEIEPEK